MSRAVRRDRRILAYSEGLEHGVYSGSTAPARDTPDEMREIGETHRLPDTVGCYAIFAGHGGTTASDICARNFVPALLEDDAFGVDPLTAIANAVQAMEAFISAKSSIDRVYYGTTLLFLCIRHGKAYTANVGDSRAVLCSADGAVRLTEDHAVSSKSEAARCQDAGAFFGQGNLNGLLNYTRSLGDLHFKSRKEIFFPHREMPKDKDILIADPHLASHVVRPGDQFIILATEQVWRALSDSAACSLVRTARSKNEPPRACARRVASAALAAGAVGRVSVQVVFLADLAKGVSASPIPSLGGSNRPRSIRRVSNSVYGSNASASGGSSTGSVSRRGSISRRGSDQSVSKSSSQTPTGPMTSGVPSFVRRAKEAGAHVKAVETTADATEPSVPPLPPIQKALEDTVLDRDGKETSTSPPSPTTPPVHTGTFPGSNSSSASTGSTPSPSRKSRPRSIYRESGRGRRARVLVPIAMWGVAPGPNSHLENNPVIRSQLPPMSPRSPRRGPQLVLPPMHAPRARSDLGLVAGGTTGSGISLAGPARSNVPFRQDSFGVPASLHTKSFAVRPNAPLPPMAGRARSVMTDSLHSGQGTGVSGSGGARVSHITASSGKTGASSVASVADFLEEVTPQHHHAQADFGRGGPAKVRYRENDIFGFLRRRKGPGGRHG